MKHQICDLKTQLLPDKFKRKFLNGTVTLNSDNSKSQGISNHRGEVKDTTNSPIYIFIFIIITILMNNLLSLIVFNTFSFSSIIETVFSESQTLVNHWFSLNVHQMLSVAFFNKTVCID